MMISTTHASEATTHASEVTGWPPSPTAWDDFKVFKNIFLWVMYILGMFRKGVGWYRFSCFLHYIHYLSIHLYTNSWSDDIQTLFETSPVYTVPIRQYSRSLCKTRAQPWPISRTICTMCTIHSIPMIYVYPEPYVLCVLYTEHTYYLYPEPYVYNTQSIPMTYIQNRMYYVYYTQRIPMTYIQNHMYYVYYTQHTYDLYPEPYVLCVPYTEQTHDLHPDLYVLCVL